MDVQNAMGKSTHKFGREQAHVAGQTNQVHLCLVKGSDYFRIVLLAAAALGGNQAGIEAAAPRRFEAGGIGAVGNHNGDLRLKTVCLNGVSNGFKVRAAAGKQDAQFFQLSHALGVADLAVALDDAADEVTFFATLFNQGLHPLVFFCRNHQYHANTHVEGAQHFVLGYIADVLQMSKDREYGPGPHLHRSGHAFWQHTGQIVSDSAAGDVGHGVNQAGAHQTPHQRPIALVSAHQFAAHLVPELVYIGLRGVVPDLEKQFPGQRITVGVQAIGGQSHQDVTCFNRLASNDLVAVHNSHDKASEIIFAIGIEARHLRGFAAYQCAIVVAAGFSNSLHHLFHHGGIENAGSEIVHEEKRSGALDSNIVDAMVYQVCAHGVVQLHHEGHFELGADAIHTGNQHRITVLLLIDGEKAAEAANFTNHPAGEGAMGQVFDALLGAVRAVNINSTVSVSNGLGFQNLRSVFNELSGAK